MGMIADSMRQTLRQMAESDARMYRSIDQYSKRTQALLNEIKADAAALPAADATDGIGEAIALLESLGYTVTPPAA